MKQAFPKAYGPASIRVIIGSNGSLSIVPAGLVGIDDGLYWQAIVGEIREPARANSAGSARTIADHLRRHAPGCRG